MIKVAGRSAFLSFIALIVTFFCIQPEVGEAFDLANNSQDGINQRKQQTNKTFSNLAENPSDNTSEVSKDETENKTKKSVLKSVLYKATAYCLKGRTANGGGVRRGIVAADPRVLPLGTRIQINAGAYSGTYIVADTGGAVKGRILDVWVPNCAEAMRFGRRSVSVSVLGS